MGKKLNLYNFVGKDAKTRPMLTGIYYNGGEIVATDAHSMVVARYPYDAVKEGKVLTKDGQWLNEPTKNVFGEPYTPHYPNYKSVIPCDEGEPFNITLADMAAAYELGESVVKIVKSKNFDYFEYDGSFLQEVVNRLPLGCYTFEGAKSDGGAVYLCDFVLKKIALWVKCYGNTEVRLHGDRLLTTAPDGTLGMFMLHPLADDIFVVKGGKTYARLYFDYDDEWILFECGKLADMAVYKN